MLLYVGTPLRMGMNPACEDLVLDLDVRQLT